MKNLDWKGNETMIIRFTKGCKHYRR